MSSSDKEYRAQYRKDHHEAIRANHLAWRRRNRDLHNQKGADWKRDNPDKVKAESYHYRESKKEIIREKARIARLNMTNEQREKRRERARIRKHINFSQNPDKIRALRRAEYERYKKNSPEKNRQRKQVSQMVRDRRARQSKDGTITTQFLRQLMANATECPYCLSALNEQPKHFDHKQPLVLGGLHSASNIIICCGSCNIRKGSLPYDVWMQRLTNGVNTQ